LSDAVVECFSNAGGTKRSIAVRATTLGAPTSASTSDGSFNKKLVPPSEINTDETATLFDERVQKTYGRYPLTITHGKGCRLYDNNNKEYLDFVAGIATCLMGHSNPKLTKAITDQMSQMHHVSNLYLIPQQAVLAKWLCDNSCADKVFFCNSGAEANEGAIKLARKHASMRGITDPVIITAQNSFHGRTLATITATAQPKYHKGFTYGGKMVEGFAYTPYNDVEALKALVEEINETPAELEVLKRKRGVAAILIEPLQGEGGIITGTKEFFKTARSLMDSCGGLLMLDEVQTGMGRTGTLWGYQNLDVEPDVFTSAKALGGGVPIGALMARGEVANVFQPGDHASTYGGNPLACAAGLAVAKCLSEDNILENVQKRGEQLEAGLIKIATKFPDILGGVRGWGLLRGIDIHEEAPVMASDIVSDAMKEGLLLVPAGPKRVRFVPPLIVSEAEVDEALEKFESAVSHRVKALESLS
jgi:acetylornithine aminotransferase